MLCGVAVIAATTARLCCFCSMSLLSMYENCILTIVHCNRPANVVPNPTNILFTVIFFFAQHFPSICSTSIHIQCSIFFVLFHFFYQFLFMRKIWICSFFCSLSLLMHADWKGIFYFVNHIQNGIDAICIIAWISHREIENHHKLFHRWLQIYRKCQSKFCIFFFFSSLDPNNCSWMSISLSFWFVRKRINSKIPTTLNDSSWIFAFWLLSISCVFFFSSFARSVDQHCILIHFRNVCVRIHTELIVYC